MCLVRLNSDFRIRRADHVQAGQCRTQILAQGIVKLLTQSFVLVQVQGWDLWQVLVDLAPGQDSRQLQSRWLMQALAHPGQESFGCPGLILLEKHQAENKK